MIINEENESESGIEVSRNSTRYFKNILSGIFKVSKVFFKMIGIEK